MNAPYDLVELEVPERAIVFVHSLPGTAVPPYTWAYYRRNNRPDFSDRVLFVNFLDADRNRALMQALPDRVPYEMGMDGARLVLKRVVP